MMIDFPVRAQMPLGNLFLLSLSTQYSVLEFPLSAARAPRDPSAAAGGGLCLYGYAASGFSASEITDIRIAETVRQGALSLYNVRSGREMCPRLRRWSAAA
jgi:hypothetical protein